MIEALIKIASTLTTYEPPHDKTNKMARAPSEDSDQPRHPPSLIRVSLGAQSFCWFCHEAAHTFFMKTCCHQIHTASFARKMQSISSIHNQMRTQGTSISDLWNEPRHDKTNKMAVRPAKIQISLGIHPVWSESSLCAQWVAKEPSFLHADSQASDQTRRMPRLIWVFAWRTLILLVLSCRGSNYHLHTEMECWLFLEIHYV